MLQPFFDSGCYSGLARPQKRWYSAEPCYSFLAIAQGKIANPIVLLDELEKAATRSDYGRLWDSLLGFLEPETAARYPDPALQTTLDLSMVSYIATANSLDPLPSPIRDRFRVVHFPKPRTSDLDALLPAVVADIAAERGLDARWIAPLGQDDIEAARRQWRGGSVRRLRRVIEAIINARESGTVRQFGNAPPHQEAGIDDRALTTVPSPKKVMLFDVITRTFCSPGPPYSGIRKSTAALEAGATVSMSRSGPTMRPFATARRASCSISSLIPCAARSASRMERMSLGLAPNSRKAAACPLSLATTMSRQRVQFTG
ncbi:AAA family ATPase [Rhodopseudomonas palustris]|uniref:AAA family ATPase n=1 Tax=Rhodopseudomonas palustris TaxID=1076 RepID=UPI00005DAC4F